MKEIRYATLILVAGIVIFLLRSWQRGEWPFGAAFDDRVIDRSQGPR